MQPPWVAHPEIERYSIGWRMGSGESYMIRWGEWAQARSRDELIAYFRGYAPIPPPWVDWVGMALSDDEPPRDDHGNEIDDWDVMIRAFGQRIAGLGLYDEAAWLAYLAETAES